MHFGRLNAAHSYNLDGFPLVEVSEEKDHGVIITNDLKISQQRASAYSKARKCWEL